MCSTHPTTTPTTKFTGFQRIASFPKLPRKPPGLALFAVVLHEPGEGKTAKEFPLAPRQRTA